MSDRDLSVGEESAEIEKWIEKALKEIDLIQKEKELVKSAEELEALERRIIEAADKLAGALVAQKVQASIHSKELKEEAFLLGSRKNKFTFLALRFRLGPESRKLAYLVYFKEQNAL